jgi:hypothetical protein
MRLPRVRFTIRRMMVLVACVAAGLYLAMTAWQTYSDRPDHIHTAVMADVELPGTYTAFGVRTPFWPSYWRRLTGFHWPGRRHCAARSKSIRLEICELEHSEIARRTKDGDVSPVFTQSQLDLLYDLTKHDPRLTRREISELKF